MIVYLDANIVIYLVEDHPLWKPKVVTRIVSFRSAGTKSALAMRIAWNAWLGH
jgi:hypothetical protein